MGESGRSTGHSGSEEIFKAYLKLARLTAHNLNNALFPILTGAEMILEDSTDIKAVGETASDIKESSEKAIEILKIFINKTQSLDPEWFISFQEFVSQNGRRAII